MDSTHVAVVLLVAIVALVAVIGDITATITAIRLRRTCRAHTPRPARTYPTDATNDESRPQ